MAQSKKPKRTYATAGGLPFGRQRIVTWLGYCAVIVLSVLASCYEVFFDTDNFDPNKFAMKLCLSISISIFALALSLKDGKTTNESKKTGDYYEAKQKFKTKIGMIANKDWFRQWADGPLYERERKSAIIGILDEYGISDYEYMLVSDSDFEILKTEPHLCAITDGEGEKTEKALDVLTAVQCKVLSALRKNFRFKKLNCSYFTSASAGNGYAYYASLSDNQKKRKLFALLYRVFMIFLTAAIFAFAAINPHNESAAQVAFDTTGRISALLSSAFMGYTLANDEMAENMDALLFKMEKIDEYIIERDSGQFVPISRDEEIRARIEAIERQRREEAMAEVPPKKESPPSEDKTDGEFVEVEMTEDELAAFQAS